MHWCNVSKSVDPEAREQPALHRAAQIAQSNDAELDVIEVMEETPRHASLLMKRRGVDATLEAIKQEAVRHLEALVAPLQATGIKVNIHVATGTPFLEIIHTALQFCTSCVNVRVAWVDHVRRTGTVLAYPGGN